MPVTCLAGEWRFRRRTAAGWGWWEGDDKRRRAASEWRMGGGQVEVKRSWRGRHEGAGSGYKKGLGGWALIGVGVDPPARHFDRHAATASQPASWGREGEGRGGRVGNSGQQLLLRERYPPHARFFLLRASYLVLKYGAAVGWLVRISSRLASMRRAHLLDWSGYTDEIRVGSFTWSDRETRRRRQQRETWSLTAGS